MDGRINVISYDSFIYENGVLVVITFPCGESDENVSSESKLTVVCGRTVSDYVACLDLLTLLNDGSLVDTCALVGSLVLGQCVNLYGSVLGCDLDPVGGYE